MICWKNKFTAVKVADSAVLGGGGVGFESNCLFMGPGIGGMPSVGGFWC